MEITIKLNGQAMSVEVSIEVYTYLDQADHKNENLAHEQRRHWDMRELDEYIIANECSRSYILTAEQKTLNQRYLALKNEVKEVEQIRKSVYSILRQE